MMRWRSLVLVPAFITLPHLAWAQGEERRFETQVKFGGLFFDNFFQAPAGTPQENISAVTAEVRFTAGVWKDRPYKVYVVLDQTAYEQFSPSSGLAAGIQLDRRPHRFDVLLGFQQDRPTFDVGDEFDRADVWRLDGEYSYRIRRKFQVTALADLRQESFDLTPGKDNDLYLLGGAIRYRGFGYIFSPEIGILVGERDANDRSEDHDQRDIFLKFRSVPMKSLYLSLQYRLRDRDYTIGDPLASNFGREDERQQWSLVADLTTGQRLSWTLYYAYQDADSTRDTRNFITQVASLRVTIRF